MSRSITPDEFNNNKNKAAAILDIRRDSDYESSRETIPGAVWKDPSKIDDWIGSLPKQGQVVVYCVRGGGVSNSVVDRLRADGIDAQFIEGGMEGLKSAGGTIENK